MLGLKLNHLDKRGPWSSNDLHRPYPAYHVHQLIPHIRSIVSETGIKGRDKYLHLTVPVGCNRLSLSLIPASGTTLLIYMHGKNTNLSNFAYSVFTEVINSSKNTCVKLKQTLCLMLCGTFVCLFFNIIHQIISKQHILLNTRISHIDLNKINRILNGVNLL